MEPAPDLDSGRVIVITGAMAAGKSTVAELLAARLRPRSVHVRGDLFRRMIVNGREELALVPSGEARAQLALRYDLAAATADRFAAAGFDAIVQDIIVGRELAGFIERIRTRRRHLVVLSPSLTVLQWREKQRDKTGYQHLSPGALDTVLRQETERIGYWLDSSAQTPKETVDDILANLDRASV